WFPDRPGMATGMAIMGFGGGAFLASPLSVWLMDTFKSETNVGVVGAFIGLGCIYFVFSMVGAAIVRVPAEGWKPEGWSPPVQAKKMTTTAHVHVNTAWKTPQFWCIWVVLCMNVTAGIGVLGQASVMSQEMFGLTVAAGAGFVGVLSLSNMLGRFFWASLSDVIGRKNTYFCFFILGIILYSLVPSTGEIGSVVLFVVCSAVILTMYGGGFATVPAYLKDMFGTKYVGAIHGRLLTAWAVAGVLGPVLVNYIRQSQIESGIPPAQAYNTTMYIMAGLLVVGLIANSLIRPVDPKHHLPE
ncbi:MAG: OFA family MFS transporter, partial [Betaproteobacteria bacterium]